MIIAPKGAREFGWSFNSIASVRPAAAMGTSVTPNPTANAKGAWVEIISGAQCARDVFGLYINVNSFGVAATAKDAIMDIGVDPAGGTSYSVLIPDLLVSCASPVNILNGGVHYYFPIWIKAGSSIAASISANAASATAASVNMQIWGSPRNPSQVKVGTYVISAGVVSASSRGTTITSGTGSDGTLTALATAIAKPAWWWQLGMGCNDSTMAAVYYHADLAIGSSTTLNKLVIQNQLWKANANEQLSGQLIAAGCGYHAPAGSNIYGRLQCSGTPDSALSLAAYGLGG